MKPLALKEIQEAIQIMSFTVENITPDNTEDVKEDLARAVKHLQAAIFSETPSTSRKFDLYKIAVAADSLRPLMEGVCHRGGYKTASDLKVLVAIKEDYDEALEGHTIGRKGDDIIGHYPNWTSLFPKDQNEGTGYTIDTEKVYDLYKTVKAEKKAAGKNGIARRGFVKVGNAYFPVESMVKLCTFMDAYDAKEIRIIDGRHAAAVYAQDGSKALIMPQVCVNLKNENGGYSDKWMSELYEAGSQEVLWYNAA